MNRTVILSVAAVALVALVALAGCLWTFLLAVARVAEMEEDARDE